MARGIVALRQENVVVVAGFERLVERNGLAHKLLLNLAEAVKTRLELKVVVGVGLGDGRDDGNVVALGAHVVGGRNDGNVDVCKLYQPRSSELDSLWNLPFLRPTCD